MQRVNQGMKVMRISGGIERDLHDKLCNQRRVLLALAKARSQIGFHAFLTGEGQVSEAGTDEAACDGEIAYQLSRQCIEEFFRQVALCNLPRCHDISPYGLNSVKGN